VTPLGTRSLREVVLSRDGSSDQGDEGAGLDPASGFVGDYYGDLDGTLPDVEEADAPGLLRSVADPSGAEEAEDDRPLRWIAVAILIGSISLYLSWGLQGPRVPAVVSEGVRAEVDRSRVVEPPTSVAEESGGSVPAVPSTWKRRDDEPSRDDEPTRAGAEKPTRGKSPDRSGKGATSSGRDAEARADLEALIDRELLIPVRGIEASDLRDSYSDPRSGGREHLALDIMAARKRQVLAVEDGRIERLFQSNLGGISIYQRSADGRFIYYYAHLYRYAGGLEEGDEVERGEVIGFVGSTGNAPDNVPHLHFAIYRRPTPDRGWRGEPINPYPVLVRP
jgi:murein DD-endopeptidase MepM/ murein hydrolase activator NlpD